MERSAETQVVGVKAIEAASFGSASARERGLPHRSEPTLVGWFGRALWLV